jgi:ribosomal subunit interface protein
VEIVLCGRNVEVPQHFREHVADKLARLERYDHKIIRMDVELSHEPNPRRVKSCQCLQITGRGRGPVVRGEGCASDFYSALDEALGHLESRLRRNHDRRHARRGRREPAVRAVGAAGPGAAPAATALLAPDDAPDDLSDAYADVAGIPGPRESSPDEHAPGQIVRRKEHHAVPMSVDDALSQMELVGHDFFLFADVATGRPSVVYRRHAYDYGVIALR